jgi:hypothetical protein
MTGPDPDEPIRAAAREVLGELVHGMRGDAPNPRVDEHTNGDRHANGHDAPRPAPVRDDAEIVPEVPAPPVAAVLRPSTWSSPAAPGEVIGDRTPATAPEPRSHPGEPDSTSAPASSAPSSAPASDDGQRAVSAPSVASDARVEAVTIDTDEELDRFVRALVARVENPRDRLAIHAGWLRFALRRSGEKRPAASAVAEGAAVADVRVMKGAVTERAVRAAAADRTRIVLAHGSVLTPLARDCARALGVKIEREPKC